MASISVRMDGENIWYSSDGETDDLFALSCFGFSLAMKEQIRKGKFKRDDVLNVLISAYPTMMKIIESKEDHNE